MALYWLCYRRNYLLAGAVIVEAASLRHAQTLAALQGSGADLEFAGGQALNSRQAALVTARDMGRLLSLVEAHRLLIRFEREQRWEPASDRMRVRAAVQIDNAGAHHVRDAA